MSRISGGQLPATPISRASISQRRACGFFNFNTFPYIDARPPLRAAKSYALAGLSLPCPRPYDIFPTFRARARTRSVLGAQTELFRQCVPRASVASFEDTGNFKLTGVSLRVRLLARAGMSFASGLICADLVERSY